MDSDRQATNTGFILGIILVALGIIVLAAQAFTTLVTVFLLGLALIIGGILEIAHGLSRRERRSTLYEILGGIINLALGGIMILFPFLSAITLTLFIAAAMIALGGYRLVTGFSAQRRNRGWNIFGGLLTLLLGLLVLIGWPATGLFVIGLFLGAQLIISGLIIIFIGTSLPTVRIERETSFAHDVKKDKSDQENKP